MSLLYKDKSEIKYKLEMLERDGGYLFILSCDGGKFGTDEICAEYVVQHDRLITLLEIEEHFQSLTPQTERDSDGTRRAC